MCACVCYSERRPRTKKFHRRVLSVAGRSSHYTVLSESFVSDSPLLVFVVLYVLCGVRVLCRVRVCTRVVLCARVYTCCGVCACVHVLLCARVYTCRVVCGCRSSLARAAEPRTLSSAVQKKQSGEGASASDFVLSAADVRFCAVLWCCAVVCCALLWCCAVLWWGGVGCEVRWCGVRCSVVFGWFLLH